MKRRHFLISTASLAGLGLPGTGSTASKPCAPPTLSVTGGSATNTDCQSNSGALPSLRLQGGGPGRPWTFGHVFKKGDIPQQVTATGAEAFQADVRNRWPDGSVKLAVLSGIGGTSVQLAATASVPAGTAITTAALAPTTAQIDFGPAAVTFGTTEWASPFRTVASGPVMSSWVYRKPLPGDAHLVAWLEVRAYQGGAVEVLPWIENGYLNVAGPATKSGRARFTLNGATKYDSANDADFVTGYGVPVVSAGVISIAPRARIVLVNGGTLSHWSTTPPGITPVYGRAYLASTKLVPSYRPAAISEYALSQLTKAYSPMRAAYVDASGGTGYSSDIGLIPNEAALFLISNDARAYRACIQQGLSLASYSIHYRDETTNRPLAFASYPGLSVNSGTSYPPAPSGTAPYNYAMSHHPAAAFVPYLVTGWNWFVEEMQFQTTTHFLANSSTRRQNGNYFFGSSAAGWGLASQGGTRSSAWQWRTCAMTACITPDADTYRTQFVSCLDYNAARWKTVHTVGTPEYASGPNNLGVVAELVTPGIPFGAIFAPGLWMNHFFAASVGWTWDAELLTSTTDLQWFRDFLYTCTVGSLGPDGVGNWNYRRGASYQTKVGTYIDNGLNVWYANWGDAYAANGGNGLPFGINNNPWSALDGTTNLTLHDGGIAAQAQTNYWANQRPALAYAVDHNYPGALAAYSRIAAAANWQKMVAADSDIPVWAVTPRTQSA